MLHPHLQLHRHCFPKKTLAVDPKFKACEPQNCRNGPNISYPFWVSPQESFCGYPSSQIKCTHKNPVLTISNNDFIIKEIYYSNNSLIVVNAAVYDDECPAPRHNLSLDRTPFLYSPDHIDFSFFYNCSEEPPDQIYLFPVDCARNATHHSFAVFHKEALMNLDYSLDWCQSSVDVAVDMAENVSFTKLLDINYAEIMKMGFALNWTAHGCSNCQRSGGRCGYDNNEFVCFCRDGPQAKTCHDEKGANWKIKVVLGAIAVAIGTSLTCVIVCVTRNVKFSRKFFSEMTKSDKDIEGFIRSYGHLHVKRYRFPDIKQMTISFKEKLGRGGYGDVYKGKLLDGSLVAVKLLNESKGNGEEFINEVASISRTSHINVVTLVGFCLEGSKRALVYEFMPNGSLEKFIYNENPLQTTPQLEWEKLLQIAKGIAEGLQYLHRGCNTRILHFDIKPHNILLDKDFCPKISDFGLAKLCERKESIISMADARGTIGYIAPEVFNRNFGGVSHKSDVYSYGMMILEMVGGRRNIKVGVSNTSEIYFPHWIYKHLEQGSDLRLLHSVVTAEEDEIARKMVLVGLWCIQTNPSERPSMKKVIEMLEGSLEALHIPPKPFLSSPKSPEEFSSTTSIL